MARKLPFDPKTLGPLTFGFDIGIASVGWAILNETRIVDLGVRCFDAAENPKTGEALGTKWRTDKIARRRLGRRADRLKALLRLFVREGLLAKADYALLSAPPTEKRGINSRTPWALRSRGLDELLLPDDWARVLYHVVKRRGFMSTRKAERIQKETTSASAKEKMGLLAGVAATAKLLVEGEARKYRTLGEMAYKAEPFAQAKRNKSGEYKRSFDRMLLLDEMRQLFERQRTLKSVHATAEFQADVEALFIYQKPAVTGEAMLKLMARCNLEPTEFRAPKYSYSAERFIWLGKLANLRIVANGERRELSSTERSLALPLPYSNKTGKITYKQLRAAIGLPQSAAVGFAGLSYGTKRNKKGEDVDPEEATLVQLRSWPDLREAFLDAKLDESWQKLSIHPDQMDAAAYALSVFQTDDEIRPALAKLDFSDAEIEALLTLDFKGFLMVSVKAIRKLLPHMELGFRYDEACEKAGYSHYKPQGESKALNLLPKFRYEDVRNPVVFRALNQARNVLNALIRLYGLPAAIHVELARDLSKSFDERREITRDQEVYRKDREKAESLFRETFEGHSPNPRNQDLLKFRLYNEQEGKCAYSRQPFTLERITEVGYCEVDHALPYSRSFDDGLSNKVLVFTKVNRDKANKTPFEYLDGANESEAWHEFELYVVGNKKLRKAKKDRLLRRNFDDASAEAFKERNLNDTRWIVKLFANRIKDNLRFAPDSTGVVSKNPVLTPSGGYTSFLRTRWGLHKNREASDLHHAQDACVIAAASASLIKRVSDYNRKRETLEILPGGAIVDTNTGEVLKDAKAFFPEPWRHFRDEVLARLSYDPAKAIPLSGIAYDADVIESLKPVLVSRAVKRRAGGEVHKAGIAARSLTSETKVIESVSLSKLSAAMLARAVGIGDPRNEALFHVLRSRLAAHQDDPQKAFAEPVYKPSKPGKQAPQIRSVRVVATQNSGTFVRDGIASLGEMTYVKLYRTGKAFELFPEYGVPTEKRFGVQTPPIGAVFLADIHKNDYLEIEFKKERFAGYFVMYEADGRVTLRKHDQPKVDKKIPEFNYFRRSIAGAVSVQKVNVDVLGRPHRTPNDAEASRGLA